MGTENTNYSLATIYIVTGAVAPFLIETSLKYGNCDIGCLGGLIAGAHLLYSVLRAFKALEGHPGDRNIDIVSGGVRFFGTMLLYSSPLILGTAAAIIL